MVGLVFQSNWNYIIYDEYYEEHVVESVRNIYSSITIQTSAKNAGVARYTELLVISGFSISTCSGDQR